MTKELLSMATGAESEAVKLNAISDPLHRSGLAPKPKLQWRLSSGSS
jgi:hypothetical protein